MSANKLRITNILELRFDYVSARNVLANWRKLNGIKDEVEEFGDAELSSLLKYLKAEAPDAGRVIAAVEGLILNPVVDDTPAVVAATAVEEAAAPVEAAPAEEWHDEAPAEAAPAEEWHEEAPAEAAPAEEWHEEAPAEEAPAEEAPVDEAPVDEAPAEEAAHAEGGKKKKKKK